MDITKIVSRIASFRIASISFWSDAESEVKEVREPCFCVERASLSYGELTSMLNSGDPEKNKKAKEILRMTSEEDCGGCGGTGFMTGTVINNQEITWSNTNALALLEILGLEPEYGGSMTIPEAKRAIMRAKNRSNLKKFERQDVDIRRHRKVDDEVTELNSPKFYSKGLSEADIKGKIDQFEGLVNKAESEGAENINWG